MAKTLKPNHDLSAKIAISEAQRGNHGPLIARVLTGVPLTMDERQYIANILDATDGKRGKAALKHVEKQLVALRVMEEANELGSMEAAVTAEAKRSGRKRSTVFAAVSESKKRK